MKGTEKRRRYSGGPARDAIHIARSAKRKAMFIYAKEQHAQGVYIKEIAQSLNMSRQQVFKWLQQDTFQPDQRGRYKRFCLIDPYTPYLHQRIQAGCTNKSQLWREIREKGFTGSRENTTKWINEQYPSRPNPTAKPLYGLPTVKELIWLFVRPIADLTNKEKSLLFLLQRGEGLNAVHHLAQSFIQMVKNREYEQWEAWQRAVEQSGIREFKNFLDGLKRDEDAVAEALRQPYSNGRTEGHVNRLKLIKRQMYGRANFDLLRLRVLLLS